MSIMGNSYPSPSDDQPPLYINQRLAKMVRRYCQIASKPFLTEDEEQEFECLLKFAELDKELDFWFGEADHFLAHELSLTDSTSISEEEKQQIKLQKCLKSALENPAATYNQITEYICDTCDEELESFEVHNNDFESISALLNYTYRLHCEIQARLKLHGFDPGPEDGYLGQKTRLAIKDFQRSKGLISNGNADPVTKQALGLQA